MGNVRLGVPEQLALALRDRYDVRVFIETGTYKGGTTRWAARNFGDVWTIESHSPRHHKTRVAMEAEGFLNVVYLLGDSRVELPRALAYHAVHAQSASPVLVWLDAHWCDNYEASVGTLGECPLLDELNAIAASPVRCFILIDDARLFTQPPPMPHDPAQWPSYATLTKLLPPGYSSTVYEDVIIAVPGWAAATVDLITKGDTT